MWYNILQIYMIIDVTTYYLEMTIPDDLRPRRIQRSDLAIARAEIPAPELNRFLYTSVGGAWYWIDRLGWTYKDWLAWVDRPQLQTWVAYVRGTPAGYFELEAQNNGDVEIAYFGLLPHFIGQGLSGPVLTAAIERAWQMNAARVWVHTCTLDHPSALANYRVRGLRIFRQETAPVELPENTPGPWPGA